MSLVKLPHGTKLALAVAAFSLVAAQGVGAQQFSGAAYTTKVDGLAVDANIYDKADDVFLNGGPRQNRGLPPGKAYFFQVTDPSGKTLLSKDKAECRQVWVNEKGVMQGVPTTATCKHATSMDFLPGAPAILSDGSLPVQLAPFDSSPNSGGEFKVWLISTDANIGCGVGTAVNVVTFSAERSAVTFPNRCAKTDNFKIRPTSATGGDGGGDTGGGGTGGGDTPPPT